METSSRTATHWVYGMAGLVVFVVGVGRFFGWPRPFDPERWWMPLLFVTFGLNSIWRLAAPHSKWLRNIICGALFITGLAVYLADVPWPF